MSIKLRFIFDTPNSALYNMCADQYLLLKSGMEEGIFVRFYSWVPPAISLGTMQEAKDTLDLQELKASGYNWIKRPTGGRAILHEDDITYSCAFSSSISEMGATISETYSLLAQALLEGLRLCGIYGTMHKSGLDPSLARSQIKMPCFLATNRDEIMVGERKLIGSAQKRGKDAVLQHGSIPVSGAFRMIPKYLKIPEEAKIRQIKQLETKCTCIKECCLMDSIPDIVQNLATGFRSHLPFEDYCMPWKEAEKGDILEMVNHIENQEGMKDS